MAGTIVADNIQAAATSTLVLKNGVANTPPTIQDSSGTQIGTFCRAWVNFNGTGTVAIRASFNVSSITDNGTGDYTVNFTTAMPDANYSVCGTASLLASGTATPRFVAPTSQAGLSASVAQVRTANDGGTTEDCAAVYIAIFR
jgi:hypothetical protein